MNSTVEFYREINQGKFESQRAKRHKERIRELIKYRQNKEIEAQVLESTPALKYTSRLKEQLKFAAREVSRKFGKPTELIGILGGKNIGKNIFLTSYHVFQDQLCNGVNTKADSIGRVKTYRDLRRKKINCIDIAHSHNRMGVFHSSLDDVLLEIETNISQKTFEVEVLGRKVSVPYSTSTVFNEKGDIYCKGGVLIPFLTDEGFKHRYATFRPEAKIVQYGRMLEEDQVRLTTEIDSFVTYKSSIFNHGFRGEF